MNKIPTTFLKICIFIIGSLLLLFCIFALSTLAVYTAESYPEYSHLRFPVLIGIYLTAIPFYLGLYEAYKLLIIIEKKQPFSNFTRKSLTNIKWYARIIVLLYLVGMFFLGFQNALHPGIGIIGFIIIFASSIISIFAEVLKGLLQNATSLKAENDLTV
ncbi:DUF2975 domain-containing protein [Saliterribacillus persicus]|uniref:DUF2975 family protein n=1 Tax=Saliterribacillus persicus TaxID=930114 RepID=A0A368X8Z1_9BACI|nr:DUF2975 domain-containing protein [Saliterribacillus persicus]RCW62514.1 DUF2975 family protein [Saliterribacillus persicus]